MITKSDIDKTIIRLKDTLGVQFFSFYGFFEKPLYLPPVRSRAKTELHEDLLHGLENARRDDHKTFVWAVRIMQKIEIIGGVPGALHYIPYQDVEGLLNRLLPVENFGLTFYPGPVNNDLS